MRKLVLAATALTVVGLGAAPAMAKPDSPVTITRDNGGVQVRSGVPGQPLLSVTADNGGVCVGFSYQVPQCVREVG